MFEESECRELIKCKIRSTLVKTCFILTILGKVTVPLILVTCSGPLHADNVNGIEVCLFDFTSEFYMPMGRGILEGLMACDGSRYRIAIYWVEPVIYRDHTFFLGYSDFIFKEDVVHYWIHGASKPTTFDLSDIDSDPLLPRDVLPKSVARSALAIANLARSEPQNAGIPLEVGTFFRQSRDHADYSYEVPSEEAGSDLFSDSNVTDVQILNALPYGRKYSNEIQSDGTLIWSAQKVLDGRPVVCVTVKPVTDMKIDDSISDFDPETLGCWRRIPKTYRAYWSFDRDHLDLKDTSDPEIPRWELHDKIETYLLTNKVPNRLDLAFNQLLFKTALLTGDTDRISRSANAVVTAICRDVSMNNYRGLLELARIDVQIREECPDEADDLVRPLVAQVVRDTGSDVGRDIERFMRTIESNKWFRFGELLIEEARSQSLVEENNAEKFVARLEAARLAREKPPADPCEAIPSVKRYLAQIDADPPAGTLALDDIRGVLKKGLEKPFADANIGSTDKTIENTIHSIRLIAGEGPFRGDRDKLIGSINKFSNLYLVVFRYREPIDTVMATFLALSFYDISTVEDHDRLFSQICTICAEFQILTNKMITERELGELVTPADVERLFTRYKERFRQYIDDPLWSPFKFPLTENEVTRLRNKLKLRFAQLEPTFEEMALKVKYGSISDELKTKTKYEIASAILQLLPQTAFLRKPPYPGVSCRHRGRYGFAAMIRESLYIEEDRPREKFKAMRYFHMGHRLEHIVKRERELAAANKKSELGN